MRVCVTGGNGFIGRHLVRKLLELGHSVNVLDDLSASSPIGMNDSANKLYGDVNNRMHCIAAFRGCQTVFHLAAVSRVEASLKESCLATNIGGTEVALYATVACGVERFVYAGSSTYYGSQPGLQHEKLPGQFLNHYALSKYAGEELCRLCARWLLKTYVLRLFNVYGEGSTGPYSLVIDRFLERAKAGLPLEIHGDGTQDRDFIHVSDVVDALVRFGVGDALPSTTVNVGTGRSISIKYLASRFARRFELKPVHVSRRPGDSDHTQADISLIQAMTGWQPKVHFEQGLEELMK